MRELVEHIITEQDQISELNWRKMAGGIALAGALALNQPEVAMAKHQPSVTQAEKQIDMDKLLNALREVESSGGRDTGTRYEPGVERQLRKRFNKLNKNVQDAITKYGYSAIATSYGPYQVLASTAYDLGYTGNIESLNQENTSRSIARKLLTRMINSSRTKTVEDVVSAYNAGLGGIGKNPSYVHKVLKHYNQQG